jgi:hypothetical protein
MLPSQGIRQFWRPRAPFNIQTPQPICRAAPPGTPLLIYQCVAGKPDAPKRQSMGRR